jgi:hypothetical protein
MRHSDPTLQTFLFKKKYPEGKLATFLKLGKGESISLTPEDRRPFIDFCCELQNDDFITQVHSDENLTPENIFIQLEIHNLLNISENRTIEFLATHFNDCQQSQIGSVNIEQLSMVLQHPKLVLQSEDSLYQFIARQIRRNPENGPLLQFVRFEYLTVESIQDFVKLIETNLTALSLPVWKALSRRVNLKVSPTVKNGRHFHSKSHSIECPFENNSPFQGIIAYLSDQYGGNVHDRDVVKVTSKSHSEPHLAKNVANLNSIEGFWSKDSNDEWICYDFKERKIVVTDYSISNSGWTPYLVSWLLEGSVDGEAWIILDEKRQCREIDGAMKVGTFQVGKKQIVRFVRIRNLGGSWLGLTKFELFGTII